MGDHEALVLDGDHRDFPEPLLAEVSAVTSRSAGGWIVRLDPDA